MLIRRKKKRRALTNMIWLAARYGGITATVLKTTQ